MQQATQPSLASRYKWPLIFAVILLVSQPLQLWLVLSQYSSAPAHAMVTPAATTIDVQDTGQYTLWISNQESVNGQLVKFPTDMPSTMAVKLVRDADQAEIPLLPAMQKTVTFGNTKRESLYAATISQAGKYTFAFTGSSEARVLYFSRDFVMKMLLMASCTVCSSVFLFVAMVVTAVIALAKKPTAAVVAPIDEFTPAEKID